jgi:integrase
VTLLLQAAPGPKYKAAFATAYDAGLRVSEVVALKLDTTARYTRVANPTIRNVTSPLDRLAPVVERRPRAGA